MHRFFAAVLVTILFSHAPSFAMDAKILSDAGGHVKIVVDPKSNSESGKLDLLFVIDNSGSMQVHQQDLAKNAPILIKTLKGFDSLNVAVTTTDMDSADKGAKGTFFGDVRHSGDATFENDLMKDIMGVGTYGATIEQIFPPVMAAFSEPNRSSKNLGFLRADAHLAVFILTDAEDQSAVTPTDFIAFLDNLKGRANYTLGAFLIPSATKQTSTCMRDSPDLTPVKIEQALSLVNGVSYNMCTDDYASAMKQFGTKISTVLARSVHLPLSPIAQSITVQYGNIVIAHGDEHKGWIYDSMGNNIIFGDEIDWTSMPKAQLVIEFNY